MAAATRHNGDALGAALRDEHGYPELRAVAHGIVSRALVASQGSCRAASLALGLGINSVARWVALWPRLLDTADLDRPDE